jgi:LacI family transcriptional regulator
MSDDSRGGYEAARNLLANDPPPTAIVACDDVMAVGVLRAAHELGFRVPRDLSVVGFDGIALGEYTVPSLTTVLQPVPELSQAALDLTVQALDRGSSGKGNLRPVKVEPSLIVRGSSSPPPAKTPKKPETEAKTK